MSRAVLVSCGAIPLWSFALIPLFGAQFAKAASGPLPASALFAGQGSYIGNAETQPVRQLDVEQDFTYTRNPQSEYAEFPLTLTYGLLPRWDVSAAFGAEYQSSATAKPRTAFGFGDIPIYSKFKLLDQDDYLLSQAVSLEVKIPTASHREGLGTGNPDYDLTWIASKDFTSNLTGDINVGYTWLGNAGSQPLADQLHYGLAVEYSPTDRLTLMSQLLASVPNSRMVQTRFALMSDAGWQISPRFQIHASITKGLGSGSRVIDISGTIGVVWTFGRPTDSKLHRKSSS